MTRLEILSALANAPFRRLEGPTAGNGFTTRWGRPDEIAVLGAQITQLVTDGHATVCDGVVEITDAGLDWLRKHGEAA